MTAQPCTTLEAYPRDTWPAVVLEVCQAAGFSLEPGDAEDIIGRMGPPYEIPRVLKRARGLAFARTPAAAQGLLAWSEAAAKAARGHDWESPLARRAKGAQARRAQDEADAQARLAEAEARALAKTRPRVQDPRMLERIAALPVSLEDLLRPEEVEGLSDADAVARLDEYRQAVRNLTSGRAVGKGLVARRQYLLDRLYRVAASDLRQWEQGLAARVREIRARERASRPPPAPRPARKPAPKRPWLLNGPLPDKARLPQPWLLRGVELDSLLAISAAERRRWLQEGRVPAVGQYQGRLSNGIWYWGTLHDPEAIKALRPLIPEWRAERKAQLAEARRKRRQTR